MCYVKTQYFYSSIFPFKQHLRPTAPNFNITYSQLCNEENSARPRFNSHAVKTIKHQSILFRATNYFITQNKSKKNIKIISGQIFFFINFLDENRLRSDSGKPRRYVNDFFSVSGFRDANRTFFGPGPFLFVHVLCCCGGRE